MINISFNELDYIKQEEIKDWIKEEIVNDLKKEAKDKKISLKELLFNEYDLGYDFTKEEKEKHFDALFENFLDKKIEEKLENFKCVAEW